MLDSFPGKTAVADLCSISILKYAFVMICNIIFTTLKPRMMDPYEVFRTS